MLSVHARLPSPSQGTVTHNGSGVAPLPWRCLPNRAPSPESCAQGTWVQRESSPSFRAAVGRLWRKPLDQGVLIPALDSEEQAFHPLLLASSSHPRLAPRPAPQSLVLWPMCLGSSRKAWAAPPRNAHARSWPSLCARVSGPARARV